MINKYRILIAFFIWSILPVFILAKSYKIVIDPGHSFKDAEEGSKIGPLFTVNGENIYAIVENNYIKENPVYDFKRESEIPPGWKKFKYTKNNIDYNYGFIESALNLEVSQELKRLLNADSSRFSAELTRNDHGYVMKGSYDETEDLKARAKLALDNNADLFLSIHFDALSSTGLQTSRQEYKSIYHFINNYTNSWWNKFVPENEGGPKALIKASECNDIPITFTGGVVEIHPGRKEMSKPFDYLKPGRFWFSENESLF